MHITMLHGTDRLEFCLVALSKRGDITFRRTRKTADLLWMESNGCNDAAVRTYWAHRNYSQVASQEVFLAAKATR
jgi:hypothetical protein